jgi:hypothetical protein
MESLEINEKNKHFFRINHEWVDALYLGKNQYTPAQRWKKALMALSKMMSKPAESQQDESVDNYLREFVYKHVLDKKYNKDSVSRRLDVFPGPMAMQLCRKDLSLLRVSNNSCKMTNFIATH